MEFIELAKNRYSCRAFTDKAVESEKLETVLEAGRLSPTAVNGQPVIVKVLKSQESLAKLRSISRMAYNAPVVILVCYDENKVYSPVTYHDDFKSGIMDSSIAFNFPSNIKLACFLDVGYADPENGGPSPRHPVRKPLNEFAEEL